VYEQLDKSGLQISGKQFALNKDQSRMFGVLSINNGDGGMEMAIGVRNSINKTLSAGICAGSRVFVCDNLAFAAETVLFHKHTCTIDFKLTDLITTGIDRCQLAFDAARKEATEWATIGVSREKAASTLVEAIQQDALPLQGLLPVYEGFNKPKYPEYGVDNLWTLYSAFTDYSTHQRRSSWASGKSEEMVRFHDMLQATCA
jgi:hypothetical protein